MRLFLLIGVLAAATLPAASPEFDKAVKPVLTRTCAMCHNEKMASGGLNAAAYLDPATITTSREAWERILAKVSTGEMPPKGIPKPAPAELDAFTKFLQSEFDRADRATKIDPGRVTAHRLNRVEYQNTVRDLLGVDFRATDEFPADDSGYGFDNNGDVLT